MNGIQSRNNWKRSVSSNSAEMNLPPGVIRGATEGDDSVTSQGDAVFDVPVIPRLTPLRTREGRIKAFDPSARIELDLMGAMVNVDV